MYLPGDGPSNNGSSKLCSLVVSVQQRYTLVRLHADNVGQFLLEDWIHHFIRTEQTVRLHLLFPAVMPTSNQKQEHLISISVMIEEVLWV